MLCTRLTAQIQYSVELQDDLTTKAPIGSNYIGIVFTFLTPELVNSER
jgi:hypothetical protein